jgi:nucleoside-diphosphate-sugar epimerase
VRVLVTGGAGFLGRHFANHHIAQDDDVVVLDNMSNPNSRMPKYGYHIFEDVAWLLRQYEKEYDLVYHFAAPVGGREKISNDPMFNADSLRIDSQFFRWAIKAAKTVVYPSSSAVYPISMQGEKGHSLHEGAFSANNPNWLKPDEMYGFTKLVGENLAATAAKYGLNTLCIRPFSGYGEGQGLDYPVPAIAQRAIRREDPIIIWGPGSQRRDFIHVSDIVGATLARLEAGVEGYQTMNIGKGYAESFDDIARACARIEGYEPSIEHDLTKPVGVLTRFADAGRMSRYYTPKVSLDEGLRRVMESLREV